MSVADTRSNARLKSSVNIETPSGPLNNPPIKLRVPAEANPTSLDEYVCPSKIKSMDVRAPMGAPSEGASQTMVPVTGSVGALFPFDEAKLDAVKCRVMGSAQAWVARARSRNSATRKNLVMISPKRYSHLRN